MENHLLLILIIQYIQGYSSDLETSHLCPKDVLCHMSKEQLNINLVI